MVCLVANRFSQEALTLLQNQAELEIYSALGLSQLKAHWAQAQALICRSKSVIDQEILEQLPQLKVIITATSGFDHIDLAACKDKNIQVMHTPEANVQSAAELTLSHILNCHRRLDRAHQMVQDGNWQRSIITGEELTGKSVGLIGFGRIGQKVAQLLSGFGVKLQAHDPYVEQQGHSDIQFMGFEELIRSSDVVSMHVPYTKETRHMIKESTLDWFTDGSLLVNTSRGNVVCMNSLIKHLQQGADLKVALDVFPNEPLPTDSPLLDFPNLSLSPHIGASTTGALQKASHMAANKLIAYVKDSTVSDQLPPQTLWADKII